MATARGTGFPATASRPRWAADEMLGRLARYLRFVGHDTAYFHGLMDDEILDQTRADGRRLLTRDEGLSRRMAGSLLLRSPYIAEQFREVVRASPGVVFEVVFERCTLCNGVLTGGCSAVASTSHRNAERPTWTCQACGHRYWKGSHTASVRVRVEGWVREART